ncbi:MAG: DUF2249 domain-containing protein, partial [Halococcoides sp.]
MSDTRLDLRDIPAPERHSKVFEAFDALESGEALELVNDHDPAPLYHQVNRLGVKWFETP